MQRKWRGGRQRPEYLMIRITELERLSIERAAAMLDEKASAFGRRAILDSVQRILSKAERGSSERVTE